MDKGRIVNIVKNLVGSALVNQMLLEDNVLDVKLVIMDSLTANVSQFLKII